MQDRQGKDSQKIVALVAQNHSTSPLSQMKAKIIKTVSDFGFTNATQILSQLPSKLLHNQFKSMLGSKSNFIEENVLRIMLHNLVFLSENKNFNSIINILKLKAVDFNCESFLKLVLYFNNEDKVNRFYDMINTVIKQLALALNETNITEQEIAKSIGYILALNLQQTTYTNILWNTLHHPFVLFDKINLYQHCYQYFTTLHAFAKSDPNASTLRRDILYKSGLLTTHLQRDPEEVEQYDRRMLSAQGDKDRCLDDIGRQKSKPLAMVDIWRGWRIHI